MLTKFSFVIIEFTNIISCRKKIPPGCDFNSYFGWKSDKTPFCDDGKVAKFINVLREFCIFFNNLKLCVPTEILVVQSLHSPLFNNLICMMHAWDRSKEQRRRIQRKMARSKIVSSAPDHLRIQLLQMEILPASILFTTQQWLIEKKYAVADTYI